MNDQVRLASHNPEWQRAFEAEARIITQALADIIVAVHHIGSTAIPTVCAKPIIDMLLEVDDIVHLDERTSDMEALGYEAMGEYGIPERRYFRKSDRRGTRTHHVHAFKAGSHGAQRHLAFRDYMIAHPSVAEEYSALKFDLSRKFPHDRAAYQAGKDDFVREMEQKALDWKSRQSPI